MISVYLLLDFLRERKRGQVSKRELVIREAMTLLLLYYVSPPTKLRVGFVNIKL